MKRHLTSLLTLVLTIALVVTMSVPGFAAEEETLPELLPLIEQTDNSDITNTYKLTVESEHGYQFILADKNITSTTRDASISVEGVNGKTYSASVTATKDSCKMRLYLRAGEYTVKLKDNAAGLGGTKFEFKYEAVESNVEEKEYTGGESGQLISLHPFKNMQAVATYWFIPSASGTYAFTVDPSEASKTDTGDDHDIVVSIMNRFHYIEDMDNDSMELFSGEGGTIVKSLIGGEKYYIQVAESYAGCLSDTYTRRLAATPHTHEAKIIIDGDHITKACTCMSDDTIEYDYWLDEVSVKNVVYNGGLGVVPVPTFAISDWTSKDDVQPTIDPQHYTVEVTSSNKTDIGKATAAITFTGDYSDLGTYKVNFKIVPVGTTLKSVKAAKNALTVKWAKQSKNTTGYQVQYSTNSKFSSAKTVTISKKTTTSKKISNLKAKKNYYVRVRTYKTVKSTKYYSAWSDSIQAKTK